MWLAWMPAAVANPPSEAPSTYEIEVVSDVELEGSVRIVLPGREGDILRVDGMVFGPLPVTTELVEGLHIFRVDAASTRGSEGARSERFEITTPLVVKEGETVELDLTQAKAPRPASAPQAMLQADPVPDPVPDPGPDQGHEQEPVADVGPAPAEKERPDAD